MKQSNELSGADVSELRRIASNRSHLGRTGGTRIEDDASIRRSSSDPKMRVQQKQRSQVEILLDRAEAQKMANRAVVSQSDVDKMQKTTAEAEEELQTRLAAVNKTSVDIMRTLDYTYYNLLEKVGNLVDIVQSFQSLSSQTKDLMANFAKEASTLEKDVKAKIETCKTGFEEREIRVRRLEERGGQANAKAQELGARLEAARQKVEAWEKKEGAERRRRSWFWRSTWTVLIVVLIVLYFGLTWREWQSEADIVRMALRDDDGGFGCLNQSLLLDREAVRKMEVPDDVKSVLSGVSERRTSRPPNHQPSAMATTELVSPQKEDPRLKVFDEL